MLSCHRHPTGIHLLHSTWRTVQRKSANCVNRPGSPTLLCRKFFSQDAQDQKALFLCTIGQGALEIYNAFRYSASEDFDRVETLISKFEEFFTEEVKETFERFEVSPEEPKSW